METILLGLFMFVFIAIVGAINYLDFKARKFVIYVEYAIDEFINSLYDIEKTYLKSVEGIYNQNELEVFIKKVIAEEKEFAESIRISQYIHFNLSFMKKIWLLKEIDDFKASIVDNLHKHLEHLNEIIIDEINKSRRKYEENIQESYFALKICEKEVLKMARDLEHDIVKKKKLADFLVRLNYWMNLLHEEMSNPTYKYHKYVRAELFKKIAQKEKSSLL